MLRDLSNERFRNAAPRRFQIIEGLHWAGCVVKGDHSLQFCSVRFLRFADNCTERRESQLSAPPAETLPHAASSIDVSEAQVVSFAKSERPARPKSLTVPLPVIRQVRPRCRAAFPKRSSLA